MINFLKQKNIKKVCPAKLQRSRGFTLVETLVAVSIFTASILVLMTFLSQGIATTGYVKNKMTASYLAQEGIEYIRNTRDNYIFFNQPGKNWESFKAKLASCNIGNMCNFSSFEGIPSGDYPIFTRKIWAETISNDEIKIYSRVSWNYGVSTSSVTLTENLLNWVE